MGRAQSSMASSWSAKASNMVLMSSRMCLVEVLGGLQWGKGRVRSAKSQIAWPWARGCHPAWLVDLNSHNRLSQ